MSCEAILSELRTRHIRIWAEGDRLRCSAPKSALTPELELALNDCKSELLGVLKAASPSEQKTIRRVARTVKMPLSSAQERFWFLTKLHPGSSYNIVAYCEVPGEVDDKSLERAVAAVVARHEILRTSFPDDGGLPASSIAPNVPTPFATVDVMGEFRPIVEQLAHQPFDLSTAPLLRTFLLRKHGAPSVFALVMHHIISDGWSTGVLLKEVRHAYDVLARGADAHWPELPVQYADFTAWQREQLKDERLAIDLDYWERKLSGCPAVLELPGIRNGATALQGKSAVHTFSLGSSTSQGIRTMCIRERATLYTVLMSIFNTLLYRYSNQESILVGVPVSCRIRPEFENLIGLFVNVLMIRTDLDHQQTARSLVRQVRESVLELHAHSEVPFQEIVDRVRPERKTASNPLLQVAFVLQNTPLSSEYSTVSGGGIFDLTLYAWEDRFGEIACTFEYDIALFSRSIIERMSEHLINLSGAFVSNVDVPIGLLGLLGVTECEEIVAAAAPPRAEYPSARCVHELIQEQCHRTPKRIAVACGVELTYAELDEASDRLAAKLERCGIRPGVRVGVCLNRSVRIPVALLGVLKAGAAYVPLDPQFPQQRSSDILLDSGAAFLVTERSLADRVPTATGVVPIWLDDELPPGRAVNIASPDDLAYIIYTSGSTGKPKGVEIPHRALVNFLYSMRREPGMKASDRLVAVTTICFDIAALEIYLPLLVGARLEIAPRGSEVDGIALRSLIDVADATVMQATPATWRILIESGWTGKPGFRILCGGEALSRDLANRLLERGSDVWNLYGPTETTVWSTVARVKPGAESVPLGVPVANTSLYILDPRGQLVPRGVAGELYIGGDGLARGYHNRPELTQEKFVSHPFRPGERLYRTGDLACYRDGGELEFLGRADNQLKVRGFRIEPGEVEQVLEHQSGVRQAVVVAHSDGADVRLVAYVASRREGPPQIEDLKRALGRALPNYMVPTLIVLVDELPLTPNGKLDRNALPKPDFRAGSSARKVRPRTPVEAELLQVWEESLALAGIGVTDNFFDLGGSSLLAVRMFSLLETRFGPTPISILFESPTVEQMARRLESATVWSGWRCLVAVQPAGSRAPLFVVPGVDGNVVSLAELARVLGPDQPVYGLQSVGLDGVQAPRENVVEIAAHFLDEIRTVQSSGPYCLAGVCLGGVVAYEMAQQLKAKGEDVKVLALLDAWPPNRCTTRERLLPNETVLLWRARTAVTTLVSLDLGRWPKFLLQKGRRLAMQMFNWKSEYDRTGFFRERVATANLKAFERYQLEPYDGSLMLIAATERPLAETADPRLTWLTMALRGCTIHIIPALDAGYLLKAPYVELVAYHLNKALAPLQALVARS
jgi:amino acid adenylation domain-containing protein